MSIVTGGRDYLFATWDGGGHAAPAMSVAAALIARGHTVRVLADPVVRDEVEAAGATFVAWKQAPHRTAADPPKDDRRKSPMQAAAEVRDGVICGPAAAFAADTRAEIARCRPDCVVFDHMLPGVGIGAKAEGLPNASLATTMLWGPGWGVPPMGPGLRPANGPLGRTRDALFTKLTLRVWRTGLPALNGARVENGLDPITNVWDEVAGVDRVLVLVSRGLEFPTYAPPPQVQLVGARVADPAWAEPWTEPEGDAPLVLVGFSSDQMGQLPVLRRIADGLGRLDARVVLTTGPHVAPEGVPAPPNVQVVRSAPHAAVMRRAAAVVTHGGHGTVSKALSLGVPLVCVPLGRDQHDIAARVTYAGAGRTVRAGARPAAFATATQRVLDDPRHRTAAQRVAATMAREARRDAAVDELEALAGVPV